MQNSLVPYLHKPSYKKTKVKLPVFMHHTMKVS